MLGIVVMTLASSGGGKRKAAAAAPSFTPVRTTGNFTLNSHPLYTGSLSLGSMNVGNEIVRRSIVTYQSGNTLYIMPTQHRVSASPKLSFRSANATRSNLNLVDLKFRLCR